MLIEIIQTEWNEIILVRVLHTNKRSRIMAPSKWMWIKMGKSMTLMHPLSLVDYEQNINYVYFDLVI